MCQREYDKEKRRRERRGGERKGYRKEVGRG